MTEDNQKQLQDLHKLLEISRSMVATVDLDCLLQLIVQRNMELLEAERATLFLYDAATQELISRIAAGAGEIRIPAGKGIAGAAAQTGQTIVVPDAYADSRFNTEVDRQTGFRTRNILAVPLRDYENQLVGVLQVLNKHSGDFDSGDVVLAETLGAQAGVVLQRAKLIEHYFQKQQMERAMAIARDIQRGLLPRGNPSVCGFDIAGFSQPADETGGDTYDFMPLPDGRWMITIADASGHGIGPALVIAETRAMLRAMCMRGSAMADVLETVNNLLASDLGGDKFVTCFFALLDPLSCHLDYISAGHGPLIFYSRSRDDFYTTHATALPLAVMEDVKYDRVVGHPFENGDLAIVTTDGFFEAANSEGEQFGVDRMITLLRRDRDLPSQQIIANLREAVQQFTNTSIQADDLTAIVIKRR